MWEKVYTDTVERFQFTPLREGRLRKPDVVCLLDISIHAPPRGATKFGRCYDERILFQFTPLREGRRANYRNTSHTILFQFTPLREGRQYSGWISCGAMQFQFTPLREGRLSA